MVSIFLRHKGPVTNKPDADKKSRLNFSRRPFQGWGSILGSGQLPRRGRPGPEAIVPQRWPPNRGDPVLSSIPFLSHVLIKPSPVWVGSGQKKSKNFPSTFLSLR